MLIPRDARLVFSRAQIDRAIEALAGQINQHLAGTETVVLTVMQGGLVFAGHLLPQLTFPLQLDYVHATRYRGELSGEAVRWLAKPHTPLRDQRILLLDDIHDQGFTLENIVAWCRSQGAAQVLSAVLLRKRHQRERSEYLPDYAALEVGDDYVFGFGMDKHHRWRNLDGVYRVIDPAEAS
ncbi:MAG TPA: hypoxanthine-guanine phosphoribosyltransferase [Gammaproteobacteria bacterium]|nr:hypoxanthine-guanine phosphoribosyltransferase [Gammaproteobacteria bacterium]